VAKTLLGDVTALMSDSQKDGVRVRVSYRYDGVERYWKYE